MEPAVIHPRGGVPAPAVGHSGANSGHGPPFASLRPPLSRAGLESNCLPGSSHFGPVGPSAMETSSALPRGLTGCPPDVPGVYRLKANSSGTSWRGRVRPLGGLTGCPPDAPTKIPPSAFLYREPPSEAGFSSCQNSLKPRVPHGDLVSFKAQRNLLGRGLVQRQLR